MSAANEQRVPGFLASCAILQQAPIQRRQLPLQAARISHAARMDMINMQRTTPSDSKLMLSQVPRKAGISSMERDKSMASSWMRQSGEQQLAKRQMTSTPAAWHQMTAHQSADGSLCTKMAFWAVCRSSSAMQWRCTAGSLCPGSRP